MDIFFSLESCVSKFTAMRIFTMRKKLWQHYAFGNLKLSRETLMKPLCLLYASYFIKFFGYSIHNIDILVKFQHIGIYNFTKEKHILENGAKLPIFPSDFTFYVSNIFSGGHIGLCKKILFEAQQRHDFLALSRTMCAGHIDLFRLYLSNIPVQRDDLTLLFDFLLWYLDPTNVFYYEMAEILFKRDPSITRLFTIQDPKLLKLL